MNTIYMNTILTFYTLTKIWQGSTIVKTFKTTERGVSVAEVAF